MRKEDRPGNESEKCGKCGLQSAEGICCCTYPVQVYCRICKAIHIAESAESQHTFLPLIMKEQAQSPEGLIGVKHQRMEVEMAEGLLKLNLVNVKRCVDTLDSRRDDLVASSSFYSTQQCLSLSHYKKLLQDLIGSGMTEAKAKIMDLEREPMEGVAGLLAAYTQTQNADSLTLFKCDVREKDADCAQLLGVNWESKVTANGHIRESFKKNIEPDREQPVYAPVKDPLEYKTVESYLLACRHTINQRSAQSREELEETHFLNYYKTHLHCYHAKEEAHAETIQTMCQEEDKNKWVQHATDLFHQKMPGPIPVRFIKELKRAVVASHHSQKALKNVEKRVSKLKSMVEDLGSKREGGLVYVDVTNVGNRSEQGKPGKKRAGRPPMKKGLNHNSARKTDCKKQHS